MTRLVVKNTVDTNMIQMYFPTLSRPLSFMLKVNAGKNESRQRLTK
jgi:hypothetical protein